MKVLIRWLSIFCVAAIGTLAVAEHTMADHYDIEKMALLILLDCDNETILSAHVMYQNEAGVAEELHVFEEQPTKEEAKSVMEGFLHEVRPNDQLQVMVQSIHAFGLCPAPVEEKSA